MKQGTDAWFKARRGRITGSNIGAALGINPWKTPDALIRQMVRDFHGAEKEFVSNAATQWGSFHESGAGKEFTMEYGKEIIECGFFVHPDYDWIGASPDGLVDSDAVIEIKSPYSQRKKNPPEFKTALEQPHYWAQAQFEMACTGRERCYFYQWSPYGTRLEVVNFNGGWVGSAIKELRAFYDRYLNELDNPKHLENL